MPLAQIDGSSEVPMTASRFFLPVLAAAVLATMGSSANAQDMTACGSLENAYGPFDYRDPVARRDNLPIVERHHFTTDVELLKAGSTGYVATDLDYTLRAFPNHHRALNSMSKLALSGGSMAGANYPAECYFDRAIRWRPDDETVRMIYGNYLAKRGKTEAAVLEYQRALEIAPNSPEVHYNLGLVYVQAGDFAKAREHAKVAYAGGYPLPGLRNKLRRAGYPL